MYSTFSVYSITELQYSLICWPLPRNKMLGIYMHALCIYAWYVALPAQLKRPLFLAFTETSRHAYNTVMWNYWVGGMFESGEHCNLRFWKEPEYEWGSFRSGNTFHSTPKRLRVHKSFSSALTHWGPTLKAAWIECVVNFNRSLPIHFFLFLATWHSIQGTKTFPPASQATITNMMDFRCCQVGLVFCL